jgi:mannose-1-phosphate guanylyltransferase
MQLKSSNPEGQWCLVVAGDHGQEWVSSAERRAPRAVQYCGFGEPTTLLQKALHRARRIAPVTQILAIAQNEYREQWLPSLWFVRPEHRFISDRRSASSLAMAAALLSIAAESPSHIVTIIPAKCYVRHETILTAALNHANITLPLTPEGVVTLGMVDVQEALDEDYLVPARARGGTHLVVQAVARHPVPWVAKHLQQNGAMAASGIFVGYAGVFAAHITKQWPGLAHSLTELAAQAATAGVECRLSADFGRNGRRSPLQPLRWCPPSFPQRVVRVRHCGWSGLRSARAVARIGEKVQVTLPPERPLHQNNTSMKKR